MIALMRVIRGFLGVFAVYQLIGFLPILLAMANWSQANPGLITIAGIKLVLLLASLYGFYWIRKRVNRATETPDYSSVGALPNFWSL